MPDPDAQRSKKVNQSAIDEIKKLGMSAALKKYTAGEGSTEFKTAMERYYSPQRLKGASKAATSKPAAPSGPAKPIPMPASAPAAAARAATPPKKEAGRFAPGIPKDFAHSPVGKLFRGKKEPSPREKAIAKAKATVALSKVTKSKDSSLKEEYKKQKAGSKHKGAFSGLGG